MLCSIFFFFFLYHNRSRGKSNIQNTHSGVGAISDICVWTFRQITSFSTWGPRCLRSRPSPERRDAHGGNWFFYGGWSCFLIYWLIKKYINLLTLVCFEPGVIQRLQISTFLTTYCLIGTFKRKLATQKQSRLDEFTCWVPPWGHRVGLHSFPRHTATQPLN